MHSDLENQIKEIVESYCEIKNHAQEIKEFILQLLNSSAKEAKRDACSITMRMYSEDIDTWNLRNYTGVQEEKLIKSTYCNKFLE